MTTKFIILLRRVSIQKVLLNKIVCKYVTTYVHLQCLRDDDDKCHNEMNSTCRKGKEGINSYKVFNLLR